MLSISLTIALDVPSELPGLTELVLIEFYMIQVSPVLPVRNLGAKDIRMRYLNSLNMSPETKSLESLDIDVESDRDLAGEWKTVSVLAYLYLSLPPLSSTESTA